MVFLIQTCASSRVFAVKLRRFPSIEIIARQEPQAVGKRLPSSLPRRFAIPLLLIQFQGKATHCRSVVNEPCKGLAQGRLKILWYAPATADRVWLHTGDTHPGC